MEPDSKFQVNTDGAINCKVDLCELFKQMSEEKQEEFVRLIFERKKITIHFDGSTVLDEILKIQNGERK